MGGENHHMGDKKGKPKETQPTSTQKKLVPLTHGPSNVTYMHIV
jgi:hypothetical protein